MTKPSSVPFPGAFLDISQVEAMRLTQSPSMAQLNRSFLCVLLPLAAALGGCANMLPRASASTPAAFQSYAQAQESAERIIPFGTRRADLAGLGFDPDQGANVTVIPYPDIVGRLAPYGGVPLEQLDAGVRACIQAGAGCQGYLFRFRRESRQREGSFMADFFNVRRITQVQGWTFEAMVVVRADGVVLFRNMGGEPNAQRVERYENPLGPLQPAGEGVGALFMR